MNQQSPEKLLYGVWRRQCIYPRAHLHPMQADPQQPISQQKELLRPVDRLSPAARHGIYTDDNMWFVRSPHQQCGLCSFVLDCWGSPVTWQVHEGCDLMSQKCSVWAVTEQENFVLFSAIRRLWALRFSS